MQANSKIWKTMVKDSHQLVKPVKMEQLLSKVDIDEVNGLIKDIINAFLNKGEHHMGLKTYINHELNHSLIYKMVENPIKPNETIEEWCSHIFGEDKFGMVLNTLEGYSNTFAEKAAKIVRPLLKEAGMPLQGLSYLFFMGNYGFTPFGIHKESVGEEGVLYHLGPGEKVFYTWDTPEYNAVAHYQEAFRNLDEMLPKAKKYVLKPGDAMFIPHQVFHIANSSEFSLSFVMDYINPPTDKFENQLLRDASKEKLYLNNNYTSSVTEGSEINMEESIDINVVLEKLSIAYRRQLLALKSNAGILRKSLITNKQNLPNGEFLFKTKPIFPLYIDKQGEDQVVIFARGHRILKPFHKDLKPIIDHLNAGNTSTVQNLYAQLQPEWDMIDLLGFIGELLSIEAIEIIE